MLKEGIDYVLLDESSKRVPRYRVEIRRKKERRRDSQQKARREDATQLSSDLDASSSRSRSQTHQLPHPLSFLPLPVHSLVSFGLGGGELGLGVREGGLKG